MAKKKEKKDFSNSVNKILNISSTSSNRIVEDEERLQFREKRFIAYSSYSQAQYLANS